MFTHKTIAPLMNKDVIVYFSGFEENLTLNGQIINCESDDLTCNINNITFKCDKFIHKSDCTIIINPRYVICIEIC